MLTESSYGVSEPLAAVVGPHVLDDAGGVDEIELLAGSELGIARVIEVGVTLVVRHCGPDG